MGLLGRLLRGKKSSDEMTELRFFEEDCAADDRDAVEFSGEACFIAEDAFPIPGRGVVVVGVVAEGSFSVGDRVQLDNLSGEYRDTEILGIEMFRKVKFTAAEGEEAGMLLKGLQRKDIKKGDLIIK